MTTERPIPSPIVLPYAPEERVLVARIEMHPLLIASLRDRGEARTQPGGGLLGVPVIANSSLPYGGWRSYDAAGRLLGQWPSKPEPRRRWWHRFIRRTA